MKLYLSSYRVPALKEFVDLIGKVPAQTNIAVLPNAKDYYSERVKNIKAKEILMYFIELGFNAEIVDLADYKDKDRLKERLANFDVVWAGGGNTFCLRHEMHRSGFEDIIRELVDGGMVYAGESAGAIVAGNSLDSIEVADDPEFSEQIIWDGLKLIDSYILPHVGNVMFQEANIVAREKHSSEPGYIELTDSQVLIVDGSSQRVVDGDD